MPTRLVVGQSVSAYHKGAKLLARGGILTADYERHQYRVQFERPELGTEICGDTDIAVHGAPLLLFAKPRRRETAAASLEGLFYLQPPAAPAVDGGDDAGSKTAQTAQAQLMVFIIKMLDRKEALLNALRELNEQAELATKVAFSPALAQSSSSNGTDPVSTEYSFVFKQEVAWAVNALQRTNAALTPALERLQQVVPPSGAFSSPNLEMYHGVRVSALIRETIEDARTDAAAAFQQHKAAKVADMRLVSATATDEATSAGNAVLEEGGSVQALVEAGASILFTLQRCAAERHKWLRASQQHGNLAATGENMTTMDAEQCVGATLLELKRRLVLSIQEGGDSEAAQEKWHLVQEIESSVNALKHELLLG